MCVGHGEQRRLLLRDDSATQGLETTRFMFDSYIYSHTVDGAVHAADGGGGGAEKQDVPEIAGKS